MVRSAVSFSLDALVLTSLFEGSSASSALSFEDSLSVAESDLSVFEDWSMSSKNPSEASSIMQEHIGEQLLERGVEGGLEAGRSIDSTVLNHVTESLQQTRVEMEADPRIGSFTSSQSDSTQHEEIRKNRFEREPRVKVAKKVRAPQQPVARPEAGLVVVLPPPKVVTPVLEPANGVYEGFRETRPEHGWNSPYLEPGPVMDPALLTAKAAELTSQAEAAEKASEQAKTLETADNQRVTTAKDELTKLRSNSPSAEQIAVAESNVEMAEQQRNLDTQKQRSAQRSAEDLYAQVEVLQVHQLDASNAEVAHLQGQISGAQPVTDVKSAKAKLADAVARSKTNAELTNSAKKVKDRAAARRKESDAQAAKDVAARAREAGGKPNTPGSGIQGVLDAPYPPAGQVPKEPPPTDPKPPKEKESPKRVDDLFQPPDIEPPKPEPGVPGTGHSDPKHPIEDRKNEPKKDPHRKPHSESHLLPKVPKIHPPKMRRVRRGRMLRG